METLSAFIPMDRRQAIATGKELPDRMRGAVLFADISDYTPLTKALAEILDPKHSADELTQHINRIFAALIAQVHQYGGSIVGFGGDALSCWFDQDDGLRAITCALKIQQIMQEFAEIKISSGTTIPLALKVAIATGPIRRLRVGNPQIQYLDVLAGTPLVDMIAAENRAGRGQIVVGPEATNQIIDKMTVAEWYQDPETGKQFALITGLRPGSDVAVKLWPVLVFPQGRADPLIETQARRWLLPPVYEQWKNGQGRFLANIRPVVALFLKFSGIDYTGDNVAGKKLDAFICWVQLTLAEYEGFLIKLTIGDKGSYCLATFGAPVLHDDDANRAVAAALALCAAPSQFPYIKTVQIGLSQGPMLAGAFGGTTRAAYDLLGNEANMAARLMVTAAPGQILASERVFEDVKQSYLFSTSRLVKIKGVANPMPVFEVLKRLPPHVPSFTTRLVGRAEELAQMVQVLDRTLRGQGQFLRLEGVAGLGKSHLTMEFCEWAKLIGLKVAIGTGESTNQGIPYYPWQSLLRMMFDLPKLSIAESQLKATPAQIDQLRAIISRVDPAWETLLPLLNPVLGLSIPDSPVTATLDPQQRHEALLTLIGGIVKRQVLDQPMLLVFEDARWLDGPSQELIVSLSRIIKELPVLLLLVHRPGPVLPELNRLLTYHHLLLSELSPDSVAALVIDRLSASLSPLALALVQIRAQGNPLYTEELIRALRELGRLNYSRHRNRWALSEDMIATLHAANCLTRDPESGEWLLAPGAPLSSVDLGMPESIEKLVLSRIDRLAEGHSLTLKVASVIGRTFSFELLARTHPIKVEAVILRAHIASLEKGDFIQRDDSQPGENYNFTHNITQEATYNSLIQQQKQELHQAVGEALEQLQPAATERLVYHFQHTDLDHKTLHYLDQASGKSQREYANQTALYYYDQALTLAQKIGQERWERYRGQVEVLHVLGQRESEKSTLEKLLAIPDTPTYVIAYLWGQYFEAVGDFAQAQTAVERALMVSQDQDHMVDQARCLNQLGFIAWKRNDYQAAEANYRQALDILSDRDTYSNEEMQVIAQGLNGLGTLYRQLGHYDQAGDCYRQAQALSRRSGDIWEEARATDNLGSVAYHRRRFDQARTYHQQAVRMWRSAGDRPREGASLYNLALDTQELGDYEQALKNLSDALTIHQATGNLWEETNVWNVMGFFYHELGDLATAQSALRHGLKIAQEITDKEGEAYLLSNLGMVIRDQGDFELSEKLLTDGLAIMRKLANQHQEAFFLSYLSTVSLAAGQLDQAIGQAEAALSLRQNLGLTARAIDDLATLAATYLAAGNLSKARALSEEVLTFLDEHKGLGPEFPQRDYFICFQVLVTAGQVDRAQRALQAAYELVMERAESISASDLRRSFLEQVAVNREIVQTYRDHHPDCSD